MVGPFCSLHFTTEPISLFPPSVPLAPRYATCHWCHVMEHESFESLRIARLLNDHFVPIKVDREERPDVDSVYMSFIQAATGRGGWPMTVFLTPDRKPFTGGTYFSEPRLAAILEKVQDAWSSKREEVEAQGERVVGTFRGKLAGGAGGCIPGFESMTETEVESRVRELRSEACETAFQQLNGTYDETRGGFGRSLKFPRPSELNFLLSLHASSAPGDARGERALEMVVGTLRGMADGGIHDYVGGGFHRYSTDPDWHVPHFEKMLYDSAQLLACYTRAWQLTGEEALAHVVRATADYLLRDMRDARGGFYSAEDADSASPVQGGAKKEGAFYVWSKEEVELALTGAGMCEEERMRFCALLDVVQGGNVQAAADTHGELRGQNVLHLQVPLGTVLGTPADVNILERGRAALLAARDGRERPVRDEKVLASWTGLTISGLATAGRALRCPAYVKAAEDAAFFLLTRMYEKEKGELRRCAFHGELSSVMGLADDYAYLVRGLLDLYEATAETGYLVWAVTLQEKMDDLFLCRAGEGRGYLSVSREDASIAYPVSSTYDGAEPSATSVAVSNLLRLSTLTEQKPRGGEDRPSREQSDAGNLPFASRAERLIQTALQAPETPYEAPELLAALELYGPGVMQVIIIGQRSAEDTQALLEVVDREFMPNTVLLQYPPAKRPRKIPAAGPTACTIEEQEALEILPRMVNTCASSVQQQATAFVCQNRVCSLPMTDPLVLAGRISRTSTVRKKETDKFGTWPQMETAAAASASLSSLLKQKPSESDVSGESGNG